jgi:ATP/maltotriose-dependent transcriptional regulator MalT
VQLADVLCERNRFGEARDLVAEAERDLIAGDLIAQVKWRAAKARVVLDEGRPDAAESLAREAHAWMQETDAVNQQAQVALNLAEVLRHRGEAGQAESLIEHALRLFRRKGNAVAAAHTRALARERAPT